MDGHKKGYDTPLLVFDVETLDGEDVSLISNNNSKLNRWYISKQNRLLGDAKGSLLGSDKPLLILTQPALMQPTQKQPALKQNDQKPRSIKPSFRQDTSILLPLCQLFYSNWCDLYTKQIEHNKKKYITTVKNMLVFSGAFHGIHPIADTQANYLPVQFQLTTRGNHVESFDMRITLQVPVVVEIEKKDRNRALYTLTTYADEKNVWNNETILKYNEAKKHIDAKDCLAESFTIRAYGFDKIDVLHNQFQNGKTFINEIPLDVIQRFMESDEFSPWTVLNGTRNMKVEYREIQRFVLNTLSCPAFVNIMTEYLTRVETILGDTSIRTRGSTSYTNRIPLQAEYWKRYQPFEYTLNYL